MDRRANSDYFPATGFYDLDGMFTARYELNIEI